MEHNKSCERNIIREIKKVQIMFEKNLNKVLDKYELTSAQAPIISYLFEAEKENREIQQKDIEEFFYLKNPTVTGILDRLETKKFIVRKISKDDKRKRLIYLTSKSKKICEDINTCIEEFRGKVLKGITKEDALVVINVINKMSENLEELSDL
jgi:DNA-binding MarR family transcriptional regulator